MLSLNIDPLPTSQGHADAQCLQMDVNNCEHHNSGLSPKNLSRALKDAGAPTFPNFSLLVSNHLAEWPELFLGKRRECLAAVSSTEQHQREYRYTSSQPQERRCHSPTTSPLCLSLLPRLSPSRALSSKCKGSKATPSSEAAARVLSPAQSSSPKAGTNGDKRVSRNQKKVRADTTPQ